MVDYLSLCRPTSDGPVRRVRHGSTASTGRCRARPARCIADHIASNKKIVVGCGPCTFRMRMAAKGQEEPFPNAKLSDRKGWLPALGTRGFHGPLSDPRADLRLRFRGSERDGRNVP